MRRYSSWSWPVILGFAVACGCSLNAEEKNEGKGKSENPEPTEQKEPAVAELTIGSVAPRLDIAHWVQNGNGKFSPVSDFKPGKVYVVEFWATWCGPCVASMPHIAETQEKYEKEVQVISISNEELKDVEKFLDQPVQGDEQTTYRELTSVYCLTADPDGSNDRAYMQAAKQNGIPTAFIVGKDGHVEWIGHPGEMDEPLDKVVTDKWDRKAFRDEFVANQKIELRMVDVGVALSKGDIKEALAIMDTLIGEVPPSKVPTLKLRKLLLLLQSDNDAALTLAKTMTAKTEDVDVLNTLGWMVYQVAASGRDISKELIDVGIEAAEKAVEHSEGEKKGDAYDTLAHIKQHQGDLEAAINYATKAVELAPQAPFKQYLDELNEQKNGPKKDDAPNSKENSTDNEKDDAGTDKP